MIDLRIVSFLPAATEMICALGLADQLVGISHECDWPPNVRNKPAVVRPALPLEGMSQREIDESVTRRLREGRSLYEIDEALLRELTPDLIVTQDLCQVCAPSGNELVEAVKSLAKTPRVLSLTPKSLGGIFENIREIGAATGRVREAEALIAKGRARLDQVARIARTSERCPRVFCMEWLDPVYCSGHWVPEMVELAGGVDSLARKGTDSVRIPWEEVRRWQPEILILMPCGYRLDQVVILAPQVFAYPGWSEIPAVQNGRVFAVDANAYFARPGPRVVEGTELLAHLIHPKLFPWTGTNEAFAQLLSPRPVRESGTR
jgi:iron complex transport system substrate-binding protein